MEPTDKVPTVGRFASFPLEEGLQVGHKFWIPKVFFERKD